MTVAARCAAGAGQQRRQTIPHESISKTYISYMKWPLGPPAAHLCGGRFPFWARRFHGTTGDHKSHDGGAVAAGSKDFSALIKPKSPCQQWPTHQDALMYSATSKSFTLSKPAGGHGNNGIPWRLRWPLASASVQLAPHSASSSSGVTPLGGDIMMQGLQRVRCSMSLMSNQYNKLMSEMLIAGAFMGPMCGSEEKRPGGTWEGRMNAGPLKHGTPPCDCC